MFAREHLAIVARWAKDQLSAGVETPATRQKLKQLIDAADALRAQLGPPEAWPANVVRLDDFRRAG